jgi:uncharacterized protein YndB with AHSA1/START domain
MSVQRSVDESIPAGAVVLSRIFDAPRELVFEAWTKVEHFSRWFGPHGAEVRSCAIDPRPGGVIRFAHRFEDGATIHLKGTFSEVVQDQRLVFTLAFVDEQGRPRGHPMLPDWPLDGLIESTVVLEDVGDGTRVSVVQRVLPLEVASIAAVKQHQLLAREGWSQTFERLGDYLATSGGRKERRA